MGLFRQGPLQRAGSNASALICRVNGAMTTAGLEKSAKTLAIHDTVRKVALIVDRVEKITRILAELDLDGLSEDLKDNDTFAKFVGMINGGSDLLTMLGPLVDLIEGDEDSSDVPSWITVLVPLVKKLLPRQVEAD